MRKLFIALALFSALPLFSEKCIHPVKYDDQEEILERGGIMLLSSKIHDVLIYQTQESIRGRRANFFFSITNLGERPINFYFDNLRASDQCGRPLRIVPKRELIRNKKQQTGWNLFASGLVECLEADRANHAGETTFYSETRTSTRASVGRRGRECRPTHIESCSSSATYGVIHNEAERQRALRQVRRDASLRTEAIVARQQIFEEGIQNTYFDSETVYPDENYSANFQIEIPKSIERDLEFILIHFDLGDEEHTFAFYTGKR